MRIEHHFSAGVYVKRTDLSAGEEVAMHEHTHTHLSTLCKGWVRLTVGERTEEVRGPAVFEVMAGLPHKVKALTDSTWLCIHATDETDPHKIDERLTT